MFHSLSTRVVESICFVKEVLDTPKHKMADRRRSSAGDSPFAVGTHKIYHRKDSYAVATSPSISSRRRIPPSKASSISPSASNSPPPPPLSPPPSPSLDGIDMLPPRPTMRTRSASYAGPSSSSSSVHNGFYSGNKCSNSKSKSNSTRSHLPPSLSSISQVFSISSATRPPSSSITRSDPSRTAYPLSLTEQKAAAKRRQKQLSESSLGRTLFEKVTLSDEKLNWSTHALPSSSVHHVGDSTMTGSERDALAQEVRARLAVQSLTEEKITKELRWGVVEVREYKMILGDNPSCIGAPLSLGWEWWVPSVTSGRRIGDGRHDITSPTRNSGRSDSDDTWTSTTSTEHPGLSSSHHVSSSHEEDNVYCPKSTEANVRTVDQYEKRRGLRLRGNQLKLTPLARDALLRRMGVPQSEIEEASRANYVAQIERNTTIATLVNDGGNGVQWLETVINFFRHGNSGGGGGRNGGGGDGKFAHGRMLRRTWSEPNLVPYSRNRCVSSSAEEAWNGKGIMKHDGELGHAL